MMQDLLQSQLYKITEWLRLTGTSVGCLVDPSTQAGPPEASCSGPCVNGLLNVSKDVASAQAPSQ